MFRMMMLYRVDRPIDIVVPFLQYACVLLLRSLAILLRLPHGVRKVVRVTKKISNWFDALEYDCWAKFRIKCLLHT